MPKKHAAWLWGYIFFMQNSTEHEYACKYDQEISQTTLLIIWLEFNESLIQKAQWAYTAHLSCWLHGFIF